MRKEGGKLTICGRIRAGFEGSLTYLKLLKLLGKLHKLSNVLNRLKIELEIDIEYVFLERES